MPGSRRIAPALLVVAGLALVLGAAATSRALEDDERPPAPDLEPIAEAQEVQPGAVVHLEFTLRDQEGAVLDTTRGRAPLVFTHGAGEIIAGLERALAGMRVGEAKRVTVPPEEAYGLVDATAVTEVPKSQLPPEALAVGARLRGQTRSGRELPIRVREIKDTTVVLDLNHPLAGRTLVFDVRIILIEPPP
jgi:FKBP-type peptidyl-prolyl cis-trans isomerase 2